MTSTLFIGGLDWSTSEEAIEQAFAAYGRVINAKVIRDRSTGRSRGFGFVSFDNSDQAAVAMQEMNGRKLEGRTIRVSTARGRNPQPRGVESYQRT